MGKFPDKSCHQLNEKYIIWDHGCLPVLTVLPFIPMIYDL